MKLYTLAAIALLFSSCQKEFKDITITPGTGNGNGSSNGNLLVKGVSISGTDTTTVNLVWSAAKKLTQYSIAGKSNGQAVDSRSDFQRDASGNIKKVVTIPLSAAGLIDSTVSIITYRPGTSQLAYIINTNYNVLFPLRDSTVFTYNAAGRVSTKELYMENLLGGGWTKQFKNTYTFDAQGNLVTVVAGSVDALGNLTNTATTTNTYDSHLSAVTLGEEVFMMTGLGEETMSPNHVVSKTVSGSGVNGTFTFSQTIYNASGRPVSENLTASGTTPYSAKATYFYQ